MRFSFAVSAGVRGCGPRVAGREAVKPRGHRPKTTCDEPQSPNKGACFKSVQDLNDEPGSPKEGGVFDMYVYIYIYIYSLTHSLTHSLTD